MHVKIVRLAIYVRVGEVHVQVQGQADHQVRGQVGEALSITTNMRSMWQKTENKALTIITNMMSIINKWRPKDQIIEKDIA